MNQKLLYIFLFWKWQSHLILSMNTHVSHFEYLKYDVNDLKSQHEQAHNFLTSTGRKKPVKLQFQSHGRHFHLQLVHDDTIFHKDAVIETSDGELDFRNLTQLYHGHLHGLRGSYVHGSIIDGIFRGVIEDPVRGKFYIEENTNFFGGRNGESPISGYRGHSVMYHQNTVKLPEKYKSIDHCGSSKHEILKKMKDYQNTSIDTDVDEEMETLKRRRKRQINQDKNTCLLYIQTDYVLYDEYQSSEVILSKIAEHVKAANRIYQETPFRSQSGEYFRNLNFRVRRIRVNDSSTRNNPSNPFRSPNLGVEKYLDILSLQNHNLYCLAYAFTLRDFDNGVLGLAWVGTVSGSSGGICERYKRYSDGSAKSLNTGIVTFKNYGSIMPSRVSHITFAHELGHNFGSPHDSGPDCTPGENSIGGLGTDGNFIMYARATTGNDRNNDKFSECSIRNISLVLEAKKDRCFEISDQPICGNQVIEENEVCDCGYLDDCTALNDNCCEPASDNDRSVGCKLKAGKACSITQGSCCTHQCEFANISTICAKETECQFSQACSGNSALCPTPRMQPNDTECRNATQVCENGECSGSICRSYGLESCECTAPPESKDRSLYCHTCCHRPGNFDCMSTGDPRLSQYFNNRTIFLQPGSACDDYNGYCDVFSNCRLVDADGPLSRLKQAIFNPELYSNIKRWIIEFWWAVMMMSIALVLLMIAFIKVCSVHTPTSNPNLPKHRPIPGAGTLQRRRQRNRQHQGGRSRSRNNQHEMSVK